MPDEQPDQSEIGEASAARAYPEALAPAAGSVGAMR